MSISWPLSALIELNRYNATFRHDLDEVIAEWSRRTSAQVLIETLRAALHELEESE